MAYQCLTCGYQHGKRFPEGRCPACRSYDVKKEAVLEEKPETASNRNLYILIVLLVILAVSTINTLANR